MNYHHQLSIPFYTFANLESYPELAHGVLTRHGGVSPSPWQSLNLSWTTADDRTRVQRNYRRWTEALGIPGADLTVTHQVHGNQIIVVSDLDKGRIVGKADGLVTASPGVPLVQRYADCTPILIYDPIHQACGIAHAGWRGTVARCAEALVHCLAQTFGGDPAHFVAGIGPAIGPCCYEVGDEVIEAVMAGLDDGQTLIHQPASNSRPHFDLWRANLRQLKEAGVREIEVAGICTSCRQDTFFSYRGAKGLTGGFAAFIMLRTAMDSADPRPQIYR